MTYSIVGVIGHIDHGKTSLVAALTGQQTDTHPEEKKRGITIDLGFASFRHGDHQFAMVDAPGHQKYVGNLLAGVSAIDIGLLVVASDQGIQAQTLEHAAIIQSLGVNNLVIALSRIDLATKERIEQVSEEVERMREPIPNGAARGCPANAAPCCETFPHWHCHTLVWHVEAWPWR